MAKKGFSLIILIVVIAVVLAGTAGYLYFKYKSTQTGGAQGTSEIRGQVRDCIIKKLGRTKAAQLVSEYQSTGVLTQDMISQIQDCLPSQFAKISFYYTIPKVSGQVGVKSGIAAGSGIELGMLSDYCDKLKSYGSAYSWQTANWSQIEPTRGNYRFDQLDKWVNGYRYCGQEMAVHVISNASWAIQPVPANIKNTNPRRTPSMPPKDMQDYYNFVYALAGHFKGIITRYSIENEAMAPTNWGATPEEYFAMLSTAYKAIKAADPQAIVEDYGTSSSVLGMLVADDMYRSGNQSGAQAFLEEFFAHRAAKGETGNLSASDMTAAMGSSQGDTLRKWANLLFKNHAVYDVMELHYYGPWQDLYPVLSFIKKNLAANGATKQFDFLEGGYGWDGAPGNGYDQEVHARDLVKILATAFGEGANRFVQFQFTSFTDQLGQPGLFNSDGTPRAAAESYKLLAGKINGKTTTGRIAEKDPGIWVYGFTDGVKNLYIIWTQSGTASVNLPVSGSSLVTDISGNTSEVSGGRFTAGISPVFVEPQ